LSAGWKLELSEGTVLNGNGLPVPALQPIKVSLPVGTGSSAPKPGLLTTAAEKEHRNPQFPASDPLS